MSTNKTDAPTFINAKRRGFLQGAVVAGGVTATAVSTSAIATEQTAGIVEPQQKPQTHGKGYELTEHVKKYYKRARF